MALALGGQVSVMLGNWPEIRAQVRSGTPDGVVQRLSAAVQQALQAPASTQAFAEGGMAAQPGTPEQFAGFVGNEIEKYAAVVRKAGITADN